VLLKTADMMFCYSVLVMQSSVSLETVKIAKMLKILAVNDSMPSRSVLTSGTAASPAKQSPSSSSSSSLSHSASKY